MCLLHQSGHDSIIALCHWDLCGLECCETDPGQSSPGQGTRLGPGRGCRTRLHLPERGWPWHSSGSLPPGGLPWPAQCTTSWAPYFHQELTRLGSSDASKSGILTDLALLSAILALELTFVLVQARPQHGDTRLHRIARCVSQTCRAGSGRG